MPSQSLKSKRVVVIGGTSGIGFAVAKAAMGEGAEVVVGSSNPQNVEAAVGRLGDGASGSAIDVKTEDDVAAFFGRVGAFDHLAFTAGDWGAWRAPSAFADIDRATAEAVFAVRFWGAVTAVKHAAAQMRPGGSVVLTDGLVAHRPRKGSPLSTAMAGSVEHLTRGLAVDLAPLRVNAICPGLVRTEIWNSIPEDRREEQLRQMTQTQPLPRAGEPEELAHAYLYLMTCGYVTGQVLVVDGGRMLT